MSTVTETGLSMDMVCARSHLCVKIYKIAHTSSFVVNRVHSVLEKSLKMLEFGIKTSRPLKVLENR